MRTVHYIVGLLGVTLFALSGQVLLHHHPPLRSLDPTVHLMYVSRHIYLLGISLVNLSLGLYLRSESTQWRHLLQNLGSVFLVTSPLLLAAAFLIEPSYGLAGRTWWSKFGLFTMLGGVVAHFIASAGTRET